MPPVSTTLAENPATITTGVVDNSGKFATGGKLQLVSTTSEKNLSPVSRTPLANNGDNIRLLTSYSGLERKI